MALKKIIKVEDPDDITTGYAGKVMEIVKLSAIIGSFLGFVTGFILKTRLFELSSASWGSAAFTFLLLFILLFAGLVFPVKEIPVLVREKDAAEKARGVSDGRIVFWVLGQYAFSFSLTFLFAVLVDLTAEVVNPFFAGNYMMEFPAAVFFFYAIVPAVVVNVLYGAWMRAELRRNLPAD